MNNINLEDLCFIRRLDAFDELKRPVLDAIDSMGKSPCKEYSQYGGYISNTDWHLGPEVPRPYIELLRDKITDHCNAMLESDKFIFESWEVLNYWFQQYQNGDSHSLHVHGECAYSNVLFLELPSSEAATRFVINGKEYRLDVSEGEILSFPGIIPHDSVFSMEGRKTVIVFNMNVDVVDVHS